MLPDKSRVRATHKMLLKHKLRDGAWEINIVPGLHSTLVSIPKIVNKDYIIVFDKKMTKTYDATTTTITATTEPVLESPRCTLTGLWLMPLKTKTNGGNQNVNFLEIEPAISKESQRKQTPSLNSQVPYRPSSTTMHWRASPYKRHFLMQYGQELGHMAWPDHSGTPQILPQLGGDAKRTHERPATRNPLNEAKSVRSPGGIRKTCKNKSGTRHIGGLASKMPQQHICLHQGLG